MDRAPGEIVIYTDGSCLGNPGPGGWAWAVPGGPCASGSEPRTTNQRMEITAVLRALEDTDGPVLVMSDSTYVVRCFRDRWWEAWRRRGWWEPLLEAALDRGRPVRFSWVKGHSGDPMNDRVDRLALEAATTQRSVSGDGFQT